ncbi:MAG: bile acid:sodium symporter [Steroidobacteraceae bacterium]|jgi:BASS family bile acid:Na+ symporter|nr:bile acid:sodium symporter [Steroidobacteraceae bacterium]
MSDPFPAWLLPALAAVTVFTVMFSIGLGIAPRELLLVWRRPGLMLKALLAVLVLVPTIAWAVCLALDLPRAVAVGIMLMAIAPGAPLALQRSLGAGGHHGFAPTLQITVAVMAVVSMPLSVAVINIVYDTHASISPLQLMKQVMMVQLLPLAIGVATGRWLPRAAGWLRPRLGVLGKALLALLVLYVAFAFRQDLARAGTGMVLAMALVTLGALALGHALGGPDPATRTPVAIVSAARNPGLALLTATLNAAPATVTAVIPVYIFVSAITMLPYILWRGRRGPRIA